jgi:hypothetical protein
MAKHEQIAQIAATLLAADRIARQVYFGRLSHEEEDDWDVMHHDDAIAEARALLAAADAMTTSVASSGPWPT